MKTDYSPLNHVKFTKIYTDGREEDFEFQDPKYKLILTANFLNGATKIKELVHTRHVAFDRWSDFRVYTPFVKTRDLCLYFVRYERYISDKLEEIFHENTFVLKVEWVQ